MIYYRNMNNYNYILKTIDDLSNIYKYKKLEATKSKKYRELYKDNIPCFLNDNKSKLYSLDNTLLSNGYNRIVIGDYGAYIEISDSQINKNNIICPTEQKYRYSEKYKNCKYYWLSLDDNSKIKIYYQKNTVTYADYKIGYYYVSVYEVKLEKHE